MASRLLTYHVFLSLRWRDTGKSFSDHLYTALLNAGFHTLRGHDEQEAEPTSIAIEKALEESRIAIIVFSKGYAYSEWCLEELVRIVEWKKMSNGFVVLPVFYDVDPSQVRKQTGSYGEAFASYEEGMMEKVKRWRVALTEVADLGGMVLQNQAHGYESKFIQEIVEVVGRKLNRTVLSVARYPIGIDSQVKGINLWVQDGSISVGILAVYGMGGIGKTTIAKTVYNLNFDKFDGSSFLANIREVSEQPYGLVRLQRQLLSNILNKKVKKIYNIDEGILKIKNAISCKRLLIVLDDVDDLDQLNTILGMREWFHQGSKIIITTRHEGLLKAHEVCKIYKVKELDDKESLQLFSWHAFGQDHPFESHMDLSTNAVFHCGGIPLALQVLGSSLSGRSVDVWESAVKKLQAIPDGEIIKKLRISYDSLPDDHDKNLFLDIACFFVGKDKDYVVTILNGCEIYTIGLAEKKFFAVVGIQNLIDRCFLTIDKDDKLLMHQLLQDLGREIICQESPQPGERSRVWSHKDSYNVLKDKTGTETVKGLVLDMQMLKEEKSVGINNAKRRRSEENVARLLLADQGYSLKKRRLDFFRYSINTTPEIPDNVDFKTTAFSRMQKLRLLQLSNVQLTGCYEKFPKELRWLCWRGFTLKSLPNDFPLENLVTLEMRNSSLTQVWKGTKFLGLLKILNLSQSRSLNKTPDFSGLPNLKRLILKDCIRLVKLHESIGHLDSLVLLNLRGCKNLVRLPRNIIKLKSLEKLILSGCSKLDKLPMELGKLESLRVLHADEISINQLSPKDYSLASWGSLFWSWLSKLGRCSKSINFSLGSLSRSLLSLSLANCNLSDDAFAIDLSSFSLLRYLNLSGNPICNLPQSIRGLDLLQDLWLDDCTRLQSLPELPMSLVDLKTVNCTTLERITNLPNLLKSLFLDVSGCDKLVQVEGLFKLEPIGSFPADLINDLGILDLDPVKNVEVELFNKLTKTRKKDVIQGLYEFGIFSTHLPGCEVPGGFSNKCMENSVSFFVPWDPNRKIRGLNICIIYGRSNDKRFQYWSNDSWCTYYVKVSNKSKGFKWVYSPTFVGMPQSNQDLTFLVHWRFGNQMEAGDEVTVSVLGWSYSFQMKEFGVGLVYEQEEKKGLQLESGEGQVIQYSQSAINGDLSAYQLRAHEYFLSNAEFYVLKKESCSESTLKVLYENLFNDSANITRFTFEGDNESDYDYSDNNNEGELDEEDLRWLTSEFLRS